MDWRSWYKRSIRGSILVSQFWSIMKLFWIISDQNIWKFKMKHYLICFVIISAFIFNFVNINVEARPHNSEKKPSTLHSRPTADVKPLAPAPPERHYIKPSAVHPIPKHASTPEVAPISTRPAVEEDNCDEPPGPPPNTPGSISQNDNLITQLLYSRKDIIISFLCVLALDQKMVNILKL